jgi:hypothetical protein
MYHERFVFTKQIKIVKAEGNVVKAEGNVVKAEGNVVKAEGNNPVKAEGN